ncbi:MAG: NAD(P)-dependent dehydrogenase (short-subunit alcohol dehydrogenase family), partial [Pseudohongiellaceae bacterium]
MSEPVCLIVGAGDYIGAAIAKRFAKGGFTVCLARRDASKSQALIEEIETSGGTVYSYSMDAREEDQVIERY